MWNIKLDNNAHIHSEKIYFNLDEDTFYCYSHGYLFGKIGICHLESIKFI
jgi:hypothetical protein